jgi:hypothetical protein
LRPVRENSAGRFASREVRGPFWFKEFDSIPYSAWIFKGVVERQFRAMEVSVGRPKTTLTEDGSARRQESGRRQPKRVPQGRRKKQPIED